MAGNHAKAGIFDEDRVEIKPIWSIDYRLCSRCGQTTITISHYHTQTPIEIDPLPNAEGTIDVDFRTGRGKVISLKHMKDYPVLWQPHVATCKEVQP